MMKLSKIPGRRLAVVITIILIAVGFAVFFAVDIIMNSKPDVIAHRGASQVMPENTAFAFEAAIGMKADGIELDVQLTSDGVPVVIHDKSLKRTTGVDKNVSEVSLSEIQELDAGSWFSPFYNGARIMTLDEALEFIDGRCFVNIELKSNGAEEKVAALIESHSMKNKCVVTSFSYSHLENIKEIDSDVRTGLIVSRLTGKLSDYKAADAFSVKSVFITADTVSEAHKCGKDIYAWTVNNGQEVQRLIKIGVDHIITDKPELVRAMVDES